MRATSGTSMDDGPDEIEALLPWYAAGTLSAGDARRVERALAQDAALQRQYAAICEEQAETIALNEALGGPSVRALRDLMAAIDTEPARAVAPASAPRLGRFARFFAGLSPRTLAWSASFGAVALLLQAGLIGTILMRNGLETFQSSDYRQLAPPAPPVPVAPAAIPTAPAPDREARMSAESARRERSFQGAPAPVRPEPSQLASRPDRPQSSRPSLASAQPSEPDAAKRPGAPSGTASPSAASPNGVTAAVTFRPDARMSDISALLASYQAVVIGSHDGVLRLRFEGMTTATELNVILTALRRERIVAAAVAAR